MPDNEIDYTLQAAREIGAYEDDCITETTQLIDVLSGLQKNLKTAHSATLLQESLHCMKDAEMQEELEVYQQSFLAALETVKLKDLLDIDSCVKALRECTDDLFYWTDLEAGLTDQKIIQLGNEAIVDETLRVAAKTVTSFNQAAKTLQKEFQQEISQNNQQIAQISKTLVDNPAQTKDNYLTEKTRMTELQHLNTKYQVGLQKIDTQKLQIDQALKIIQTIPTLKSAPEQQNAREKLAIALHQVRLADQRSGFNHFVNKCKRNVEALCQVRASYLKKEDSALKSFGKTLWKMAGLLLHIIPIPSLPDELPSFAYESVASTAELAEHIKKPTVRAQLRNRNSFSQPRVAPLKKVNNFFKKAISVLLGVGGLVLAGLMCLTGFGILKGLAIATTSVEMLNAVKKGSDYFTESAQELKYNKKVTAKLTSLEKQHEDLQQQTKVIEKTTKPNVQEQTRQRLNSESKIDLLLMGHKTDTTLSTNEIANLSKLHNLAEPEHLEPVHKKTPASQIGTDISKIFNPPIAKPEAEGEPEGENEEEAEEENQIEGKPREQIEGEQGESEYENQVEGQQREGEPEGQVAGEQDEGESGGEGEEGNTEFRPLGLAAT